MPEKLPKGSRTLFERGPQAARRRGSRQKFGGNNSEEADRHLLNYHETFRDGSEDDRNFRLTRSIVVAARRWRKVANDRIRPLGQTMARWEAMFLVAFSGPGLTQSELARLISVSGPTMVRMLDQLAQEGLIKRFQSDVDARVTTNEITPKGLAAIAQIMNASNQTRREVVQGIEPEKLEVCLEVLNLILRRLDELD